MRIPRFTVYAKESGVEISGCEKKQQGKPDEGRIALRFFRLAAGSHQIRFVIEPWEAFEVWLRRFSSYVATKLAMLQALNKESEMFRVCRSAMYEAANPLFARAKEAGEIRADVQLDDVLRMVSGVTAGHYDDDAQRERVFTLALDAVRVR